VNDSTRQQAIYLYDRFTHEDSDRRAFMAAMVKLAGSVAAAELLIASIAASPAAAAVVPENDPRIVVRSFEIPLAGGSRHMRTYAARSFKNGTFGNILMFHENRGLNDHIKDMVRRLALEGYAVIAPDLLSSVGGTPKDEDKARTLIGALDLSAVISDTIQLMNSFGPIIDGPAPKIGAVGFCWGGGFVNRLAVAAGDRLAAAVSYYGPAPDPSEAPKVQAAMEFHNAGLDDRVNATSFPWITALRQARKRVKFFLYEGVNHAFNNDTSAERYNKAAADLAWKRTLEFFGQYLA